MIRYRATVVMTFALVALLLPGVGIADLLDFGGREYGDPRTASPS